MLSPVPAEPVMVVRPADLPDPSSTRIERIAAVGRLVFTAFTFVALSVDPTLPGRYAHLTYVLLVGYLAYAAAFAAYTFARTPGPRVGLATHVLDLVLITIFQYLTAWTTSPFFVYFTFALVVATMRWQWRGVLWTALFALVAFNALGAYATLVLHDPVFELNRFLIRNFYLIVTATLLGYLGYIEHELRAELARRIKKAAADAERVHLSRDLHDGVLQTLTGTALQLQTAERLIDRDPAAARAVLNTVQRTIADEQRDLRFFIQELKPGHIGVLDEVGALSPALLELGRRLESVWGVRLRLPEASPRLPASELLPPEIYRIVQEAAVNAARHGQATEVTVSFGVEDGRLAIAVADNGHGFPFRGRLDHAALAAAREGPRNLRERVVALGGTMEIESGAEGSRLDIRLPVPPAGA
jgi:signal transduction histidine kinase